METKSNKSMKTLLALSVLLNVALLVVVIIQNSKSNEQTQQIEKLNATVTEKDNEVIQKTKDLEVMKGDLERIKAEREKLGLKNDSLDQQIATLNTYIGKLKSTSKLDAKQRKELEAMVAQLREDITRKDTEIHELKMQNDSLVTSVSNLTADKVKLSDSLSATAKELAYASILKAEGVKVTALKENGKEMDDAELKGSRIDRLKINFSIADNKAAKKNGKKFYIALVPPSGKIFSDINNGGGFVTMADGSEVPFTLSQDISFDNSNQRLTYLMPKGFNYVPGQYKVAIYCEGYNIGEGKFTIK